MSKIKLKRNTHALKNEISEHDGFDKNLVSSLNRNGGLKKFSHLLLIQKVLNKKERGIIKFLLLVIFLCVLIIGGIYYLYNTQKIPLKGGQYVEGLIGAPQFINPLLASTNDVDTDIAGLIYSGILKFDKNLELKPDLASDYSISDDQKVIVVNLKQNVFWHDGKKLSADDVVFTYKSIQDPDFKSPLYRSSSGMVVEKTGEYQVAFKLQQAFPAFLELLVTGILPEHIWGEIPSVNANLTEYNLKPIGTGSWKFSSLLKDKLGNIKSYTISPFQKYYSQKPYLQSIVFKFYSDFDAAVIALNQGNIEGISYLPKEYGDKVRNSQFKTYIFHLPQYTAIFFNQKNNEAFKQKEVRQALAYSIDKAKILTDALHLKGEIIHGPILPGFIGYNTDIEKTEYNPSLALQLLEKVGWKKIDTQEYEKMLQDQQAKQNENATSTQAIQEKVAADQNHEQDFYLKSNNKILELELTSVDLPENVKALEIIKKSWENIGIKVNASIISTSKIIREVIKPRNYQVLLFGIILGSENDPLPFWHSSQVEDPGLNLANYSNRKIDKILEDAKNISDPGKKGQLYSEFQNIIIQDIPAVFLYNPTYTYLVDKKIKGIDIERIVLPKDRLNNLTEWYIKSGRIWK